jgi:F0F1-type ATP synthase gamma subunit
MPQKKVILEQLEALRTIKELAQSYEEIAIVKMQQIRDSVLKTRDFLADISDVYVDLKASYNREVKDLMHRIKQGDKGLMPRLQKKKKTLLVYLASNQGLYGAVTQKTFRLFMQELVKTKAEDTDLAIIGNAGRTMYENVGNGRPYEYFEIPDTTVDVSHIKMLMTKF